MEEVAARATRRGRTRRRPRSGRPWPRVNGARSRAVDSEAARTTAARRIATRKRSSVVESTSRCRSDVADLSAAPRAVAWDARRRRRPRAAPTAPLARSGDHDVEPEPPRERRGAEAAPRRPSAGPGRGGSASPRPRGRASSSGCSGTKTSSSRDEPVLAGGAEKLSLEARDPFARRGQRRGVEADSHAAPEDLADLGRVALDPSEEVGQAVAESDAGRPPEVAGGAARVGDEDELVAGPRLRRGGRDGLASPGVESLQQLEQRERVRRDRRRCCRRGPHSRRRVLGRGEVELDEIVHVQQVAHLLAVPVDRSAASRAAPRSRTTRPSPGPRSRTGAARRCTTAAATAS